MEKNQFSNIFKEVYIMDSFSLESHHEQYNASFAIILNNIFNKVYYYVGKGQKKSLLSMLNRYGYSLENISFQDLNICQSSGKFGLFKRYMVSLFYNLKIIIKSKPRSIIIYNCNNPFSLLPIKLINILLHKTIIIINHGELEYITNEEKIPFAKSTRLIGKWMKLSLRFARNSKNIYYLLLGDSIMDNLIKYNLVNPNSIISLEHPYLFDKTTPLRTDKKRIVVGIKNIRILGIDTDKIILNLANSNKDIDFYIIGSVTHVEGDNIFNYTSSRQFDRSEYESIMLKFNYLLFLYPNHEYKLKASGAIFDAINLGIPIISTKNDYFEHISNMSGSIGYIFDNIDDMLANTCSIFHDRDNLTLFNDNIYYAKHIFAPDNISIIFKSKLNSIMNKC